MAGRAERAAGLHDHAVQLEPARELRAVHPARAHPQDVGLARLDLDRAVAQRLDEPVTLQAGDGDPAGDARTRRAQRLERAGLGQLVDAEVGLELLEQRLRAVGPDRVAAAQPREAPRLRQRAEHEQPIVALEHVDARVAGHLVGVVDERLVEEGHDALGQRRQEVVQLDDAHQVAGRVVRVAHDDDARLVVDRGEQALGAEAGDRDGAAASAPRELRVERIRRPRGHELVVGLEHGRGGGAEELRGPVADHDPRGLDAVAVGQLGAQLGRARVGVAVQPAPRRVGDRVDDVRVREARPRGAGEVDGLDARERRGAPLGRLALQILGNLLLGEPLELAVVVEQAH